jgi:putative Mg2+ transporter-C (MgtC) family protein
MASARNMNIYIEFESTNDIGAAIELLKETNVKIYDVEITKLRASDGLLPNAILSIRIPKKLKHAEVIAQIASIPGVHAVEEL